jgi:tetratricopeptide (TPR) repeat protein
MKLDPILAKAVRFARKRNYDQAIKTLEPEANRYYGSFTYYYLLGLSYLHSRIFGMALTYLRLAYDQKMRDPSTLLGLAALYLNHGDTDKAVDLYLEVQNIEESNRIAKKALKIIRKHPGPENISSWIDTGSIRSIFPPFPKVDISGKTIALYIIAVSAVLLAALGIVMKAGFISLSARQPGRRALPAEIALAKEERDSPVQAGGSYRYVLTRNQVLDEYGEALKLFADYRDESARIHLNRIIESNAADPVKNRARLLISYMETPGFDTLKDRFSYSEVMRDPFIYRDCHIIWRGMATNLIVEENRTFFDFLVGYDTRRAMEGIVQVDYDFAIPVNPERPLEILGRVIPVSSEREVKISIQGVALNQAGLLEQK